MSSLAELDAVVFDTDGVITDTAVLHAAAWKQLLDEFLERRGARDGCRYPPFDPVAEYLELVDGKPRLDGVRSFLGARGLDVEEGGADDSPGSDTVWSLGDAKDGYFQERLASDGVHVFADAVALLDRLVALGRARAVVSASRNARAVLEAAGVLDCFDVAIDGVESEALGLAGKPDPALFLAAAERLGVEPGRAAVVEDAVAGVEAGRRGGFGLVIGVDRVGHGPALAAAGADVVVTSLDELEDLDTITTKEPGR